METIEKVPDIEIVHGSPEDAEGIVNVHKESWIATYPNEEFGITKQDIEDRNWDDTTRIEGWRSFMDDENVHQQLWVAKLNGAVIGYAVGKTTDENELSAIYLLPEYKGKGIGAQLMNKFLAWADPSKNSVVTVAKYNTDAIDFYTRYGFKGAESIPAIDIPDFPAGKNIPLIRMRKQAE